MRKIGAQGAIWLHQTCTKETTVAKERVESCLILDAFWLRREQPLVHGAHGSIRWSWSDQPIAEVVWYVAEGDLFLLRRADDIWDRSTPPAQWIELEYASSHVGPDKVWFSCPGCGGRARKLYLPPSGGTFSCRTCRRLSYRSQHCRPTVYNRYHQLKAQLDALRVGSPRWFRTLKKLEEVEDMVFDIDMSDWRRELEAAVCGPEVVENPSSQTAPSPPAQEAPASKPPPQRPRGRPRSKRPYTRKEPRVLSPRTTDTMAYCPKCRDRRELLDPRPVTYGNGRPAMQGRCAVCGTTMGRIVKAGSSSPPPVEP